MAISVVQRNAGHASTGTLSVAFGSNVTSGNSIIVAVLQDQAVSATVPSDTLLNSFSSKASNTNNGISAGFRVFQCDASVSTGADTVSRSTGNAATSMFIFEVSGLAAINSFDSASSLTTGLTSGSITTQQANELLIGI